MHTNPPPSVSVPMLPGSLDAAGFACGWNYINTVRRMQPLPKGVTGFDAPKVEVSAEQFATACHSAARSVGGRVHEIRAAYEEITPNFHQAVLVLRDRPDRVRVVCNAHHPIVAFTALPAYDRETRLRFVDCPELAEALSGEYSIVSGSDACAAVSAELIAELGEAELIQLRYWKPQRIGDVIFNYWD